MTNDKQTAQTYLEGRAMQKAMRRAVDAAKVLASQGEAMIRAGAAKYAEGSQLLVDAITLEEAISASTTLHHEVKAMLAKVATLRKAGRRLRMLGGLDKSAGGCIVRNAERQRKLAVRGELEATRQVAGSSGAPRRGRKPDLGFSHLLDDES